MFLRNDISSSLRPPEVLYFQLIGLEAIENSTSAKVTAKTTAFCPKRVDE
jgi:hypothetical protein